jgi:hypothetical protein
LKLTIVGLDSASASIFIDEDLQRKRNQGDIFCE